MLNYIPFFNLLKSFLFIKYLVFFICISSNTPNVANSFKYFEAVCLDKSKPSTKNSILVDGATL